MRRLLLTCTLCRYEEGSASRALIDEIQSTYYLVNIVDNDFVNGDVFAIFRDVIDSNIQDEALRGRVRDLELENSKLKKALEEVTAASLSRSPLPSSTAAGSAEAVEAVPIAKLE